MWSRQQKKVIVWICCENRAENMSENFINISEIRGNSPTPKPQRVRMNCFFVAWKEFLIAVSDLACWWLKAPFESIKNRKKNSKNIPTEILLGFFIFHSSKCVQFINFCFNSTPKRPIWIQFHSIKFVEKRRIEKILFVDDNQIVFPTTHETEMNCWRVLDDRLLTM